MMKFKLADRIQSLVDSGISGTDILHGELKNMMYECEQHLVPLLENSNKLGSDEEYSDTVERLYQEGFMDALTMVYSFTYELAFAIDERRKNAE